jgi:hypothetical protein
VVVILNDFERSPEDHAMAPCTFTPCPLPGPAAHHAGGCHSQRSRWR